MVQRRSFLVRAADALLHDHRIHGRGVLPGAAALSLLEAALAGDAAVSPMRLERVVWPRACVVDEGVRSLDALVRPVSPDEDVVELVAPREDGAPTVFCRARAPRGPSGAGRDHAVDLAGLRVTLPPLAVDGLYARFAAYGIEYGPAFRTITALCGDAHTVLARVEAQPVAVDLMGASPLSPTVLDGAFQAVQALTGGPPAGGAPVPFALDALMLFAPCPPALWVLVRPGRGATTDLTLCDDAGSVVVAVRGYATRIARPEAVEG